jgi:hypothetical protein
VRAEKIVRVCKKDGECVYNERVNSKTVCARRVIREIDMSSQPPASYTIAQLKEKLRELDLPTSGNKAELLKRLHEANPDGGWMEEDTETPGPSVTAQEDRFDTEKRALTIHEREMEILRKEKELAEREVQAMRREIELLRGEQHLNRGRMTEREDVSRDVAKASISAIADLLGHFNGNTDDYRN